MKNNMKNSQGVEARKGGKYFLSILAGLCLTGFALTNAYALHCVFETPSNGNLGLGDEAFIDVSSLLPAGSDFIFFGVPYGPGQPGGGIFVGSNGFVTFGSGSTDFTESLIELTGTRPIIAAFWDDLNPSAAGAVKAEFQPHPDRLIVTWDGVPEYPASGSNTFQVTLYLDTEAYEIVYNGMTAADGAVGVSPGVFSEVDLSASKVAKGKKLGGIGEIFTGGGNSFDLDGRCLQGKPLVSPTATPTLVVK